jgi:hypothetical protein
MDGAGSICRKIFQLFSILLCCKLFKKLKKWLKKNPIAAVGAAVLTGGFIGGSISVGVALPTIIYEATVVCPSFASAAAGGSALFDGALLEVGLGAAAVALILVGDVMTYQKGWPLLDVSIEAWAKQQINSMNNNNSGSGSTPSSSSGTTPGNSGTTTSSDSNDALWNVKNNSNETIWFKPETDMTVNGKFYSTSQAYSLAPGEEWDGRVDGIAIPSRSGGKFSKSKVLWIRLLE